MARACARTRSPAPSPKTPAAPCHGSARLRRRARGPCRPAEQAVRPGFRPCRAPHTRAPAPVQGLLPPIDPELDLTPSRPLYPARPEKAPMTLVSDSSEAARPRESGDPVLAADLALDSCLRGNEREGSDPLTGRRVFFTLTVLASMAGLIWLLAFALTAGGFGVIDFILVVLFAITLP